MSAGGPLFPRAAAEAETVLAQGGTVLIDGRSGSGKTGLAERLAERSARLRGVRPQLIGMDELYPGWAGLAAGSASLDAVIRKARYLRYDWERGAFGEELGIARSGPLIIEGCGALTRASLGAARDRGPVATVWVECPAGLRRARALERDGEMFAPHWESWAAQEDAHFARASTLSLAREIVHTAAPAGR